MKINKLPEGSKKYATGWNIDYYVNAKGEFCSYQNGTIRKQNVGTRGLITYYYKHNRYRKRTKASIIVAQMFIPEYDKETMVPKNKNGDTTDNRVENIYFEKRSNIIKKAITNRYKTNKNGE